jgi:homoserine dehydrogenase
MTTQKATKKSVGIIGYGGIGRTLVERLQKDGYEIAFIKTSTSVMIGETKKAFAKTSLSFMSDLARKPDVICLCIPTLDAGETAASYIIEATSQNIPIVTCEKGSLSFQADQLRTLIESTKPVKLRYTASVGGGTQLLRYVRGRKINHRICEMEAVINGTCNFIFDQTARGGRSLGEACAEATRLGYAEPGATDPLSLINGELKDVLMKTCVLFNTALATKTFITPRDLGTLILSDATLHDLSRESARVRLVVSFSNIPGAKIHEYAGCQCVTTVDGWQIQAGFRKIHDGSQLSEWLPGGVGNAIRITEGELGSGGRYTLTGPGAGYEPTTSAMLNDIEEIIGPAV